MTGADVTPRSARAESRISQYDSILSCLRHGSDPHDLALYRTALDIWWQHHDDNQELADPALRMRLISTSLNHAQICRESGRSDAASWVLAALAEHVTDPADKLHCQALLAEMRQDWDAAAENWQIYAALQNPVATKSGSIFPENAQERSENMVRAFAALRSVRIRQAQARFAEGRMRAFRELVGRVIESLPDQRGLNTDPDCLEIARHYVQEALRNDGAIRGPSQARRSEAGLSGALLSRLVLCLDIWGDPQAPGPGPGRMALDLCAAMLAHDPDLRIDLVVTHERLVMTSPLVAAPADPFPLRDIPLQIQAALTPSAMARLHLHLPPETGLSGTGLEGVVRSAATILSLQPDLVLHVTARDDPDMPSNQLLRHVLFDHVATAILAPDVDQAPDQRCDAALPAATGHDPAAARNTLHAALTTALSAGQTRLSALQAPQDPVQRTDRSGG